MTDPVIRIVDDDPHMHDALQFVLESEGYSVRHFFSAEDFLAGDFLSDPGCAVLDVRMGKMSGLVLQRVLKEREVDLPVIFLSAHGDIEMAVDAIDSGAVTFLTKPVRAEKLLTAVDKAFPGKALQRFKRQMPGRRGKPSRHSPIASARLRFSPGRSSPTDRLQNAWSSPSGRWNFIAPAQCASSAPTVLRN